MSLTHLTHEESFALERIRDLVRETCSTIYQIGRPVQSSRLEEITNGLNEIESNASELLIDQTLDEDIDTSLGYDDFPNNLMLTDIEYDF